MSNCCLPTGGLSCLSFSVPIQVLIVRERHPALLILKDPFNVPRAHELYRSYKTSLSKHELVTPVLDEISRKKQAYDHPRTKYPPQILQQTEACTGRRFLCPKASSQVCNNRHHLGTTPLQARRTPQEQSRTSGPRSRTRTREGKYRTNWPNADSVSRLSGVCFGSSTNLLQEIKSKSKERRLKEKWKTNGAREAHTYLQNQRKLGRMRTFQACHGEGYP